MFFILYANYFIITQLFLIILVVACAANWPKDSVAALLALFTKVLAKEGPPKKNTPPITTKIIVNGIASAGEANHKRISSTATIRNNIHAHLGIAPT